MTVGLNVAQARANSSQDMIVFEETNAIMKAIIAASELGMYEATISNDSTMTTSTPTATKIGTVNNPNITPGDTLIINNTSITLGTSGTNLNCIVADINDAAVPGVTAEKDNDYLVLKIETSGQGWVYEIGSGSANTILGFTPGVYNASAPASVDYFNVWQGVTTDRALSAQIASVEKYFTNMGYKVLKTTNTSNNSTFNWNIFW